MTVRRRSSRRSTTTSCSPRRCPSSPTTARWPGLRSGLLAAHALTRTADPERIAAISAERRATKGRPVEEHEAKRWLRAAGIPVPDGRLAADADDAVRAWRGLGGPVAMKATGLRHKAAAGGLELDVDDEDAVRAAFARGLTYVERMVKPGLELLVAVDRTAFVPVLVVGLGGAHTELLDRVEITPLPARGVTGVARTLQDSPYALIELNPVIDGVAVDALADEEAP